MYAAIANWFVLNLRSPKLGEEKRFDALIFKIAYKSAMIRGGHVIEEIFYFNDEDILVDIGKSSSGWKIDGHNENKLYKYSVPAWDVSAKEFKSLSDAQKYCFIQCM